MLRAIDVAPADMLVVLGAGTVLRNVDRRACRELGTSAAACPPSCDVVIVGVVRAGLAAGAGRRVGGAEYRGGRRDRVRRRGEHVVADRELPRFPCWALWSRSRRPRDPPGQGSRSARRPGAGDRLTRENDEFTVNSTSATSQGRTLIVATGAQYCKLDAPDLERYEGIGVYYAATQAESKTWRTTRCWSSAAATRRVRQRCSSAGTRAAAG